MKAHDISPIDHGDLTKWLQGRRFEDWKTEFDQEGFVIFEGVMPEQERERVRDALRPHFTKSGRNHFEGFKSNRVYALLAKSPQVFSDMITHPLALAFAEADLGESCLLSALLAINLLPGETVQGWHHDDGSIEIPLPRPSFGVSAFWAIDSMTEDNGATEIIPRSHLWQKDEIDADPQVVYHDTVKGDMDVNRDPYPRDDSIKVTMPGGSLMLAKGTLWHRGGANKSDRSRLIVTPQYCPGWARQLENMLLAVPKDVARQLPKRARQLIGYNIHNVFMGYVDGVHPDVSLELGIHDP